MVKRKTIDFTFSTTSVERVFSTLKINKTMLHSNMLEDDLLSSSLC